MGLLAVFFFRRAGGWPAALTPNLEDQVVFDQGFLPLAFDKPISNCKAAVIVLVRPGAKFSTDASSHVIIIIIIITILSFSLVTDLFSLALLLNRGPGRSVGKATPYGVDGPGIESRWGRDFPHLSRPALRPTQPPVQWIPDLSRG